MNTLLCLSPGGKTSGSLSIELGLGRLDGEWHVPACALGFVVFAHCGGSNRYCSHNRFVARALQRVGIGTLLLDLLTADERAEDAVTGHLRFAVGLQARRLHAVSRWLERRHETRRLGLGYFGSGTGGAVAMSAAATPGARVDALVCRAGRPDLVANSLPGLRVPTLQIAGEHDTEAVHVNRAACSRMHCRNKFERVAGVGRDFAEPGAAMRVADLTVDWFQRHLAGACRQ